MYIAVCDDQAEELESLLKLLRNWQTERNRTVRYKAFRSAAAMLDVAHKEAFTLYLLDVMMPGISGMEAAREIRTFDAAAEIVFLTSSPGFAYESYGVKAMEYLLKPISYTDFLTAANKALKWYELSHREAMPTNESRESIFVKSEYKLIQIELRDILYIEGLKDYVKIFVEGESKPILSLMSMKNLEDMLPVDRFVRVHRSFIVQPEKIKVIERGRIVFGHEYIPISDNYKQRLQEAIERRSIWPK